MLSHLVLTQDLVLPSLGCNEFIFYSIFIWLTLFSLYFSILRTIYFLTFFDSRPPSFAKLTFCKLKFSKEAVGTKIGHFLSEYFGNLLYASSKESERFLSHLWWFKIGSSIAHNNGWGWLDLATSSLLARFPCILQPSRRASSSGRGCSWSLERPRLKSIQKI